MKLNTALTILFMFSSLLCVQSQIPVPKVYQNEQVQYSEQYQKGNDFQKDFLLFINMLQTTHPAFASTVISPFNLDSMSQVGYKKLAACTSENQFHIFLTSIASLLNDGHTYVKQIPNKNGLFYLFQIAIDFPDVYLATAPKEFEMHLGQKIVSINHLPVWDVIQSFRNCMSCDNDIYWRTKVAQYMQMVALWEQNPFVQQDSTLILSLSNGYDITLLPQRLPQKMQEALAVWKQAKQSFNDITRPQKMPFFYTVLEKEQICYFQFNQCVDNSTLRWQDYMSGKQTPEKELDSKLEKVPRFDTLVAAMFKTMQTKNIQTLVIDLRNNGGGNSILCDILLSYLKPQNDIQEGKNYTRVSPFFGTHYPQLYAEAEKALSAKHEQLVVGKIYLSAALSYTQKNTKLAKMMSKWFQYNSKKADVFKGDVIFIQSKNTYSSAGLLVTSAIDNGIGKVIGEKSTYKPCSYGDILSWMLPNTKIQGGISHKIFNRLDENKCNEPYITPNILIEHHLNNSSSKLDECWEWIITNRKKW